MIFSKKINHFMKLIEVGSFIKASEALFLTTSALRHSIYELEDAMSSKLFYREHGGVTLTENGRVLYDTLYPIYKKGNSIYNDFVSGKVTTRELKILIDGLYYPRIANKLDHMLSEAQQNIVISHIQSSSLQELFAGRCDIAISTTVGGVNILPKNISDVTLSCETLGFLIAKKNFKKYLSLFEMCRNEKMIVRDTMLNHPVIEHIYNLMKHNEINFSVMGLPDVVDISNVITSGTGFTVASAEILKEITFNNHDYEFIPNPFPESLLIERHMFFDSNLNPGFNLYADILKM